MVRRIVGLLTMQKTENYGAVLQAYALQRSILSMGVKCEIIDLLRPEHKGYKITSRNIPLSEYSVKKEIVENDLKYKIKILLSRYIDAFIGVSRRNKFKRFDNEYFKYHRKTFKNIDELYSASLDYDAYVTGSDQVWNPTYPYSPEPYFLTFVKEKKKRIAYAPSFGVSYIEENHYQKYKEWLNGIGFLSVRERHGADIIRKITGRDAQIVLDPTLLLSVDEWLMILKKPKISSRYIFCYTLSSNPDVKVLCEYIKKKTGFPIYRISNRPMRPDNEYKDIISAGPREFLGFIKYASIVITDSFHGTALSINMQKPFYVIKNTKNIMYSRNSRIENIVEMFNLNERIWSNDMPLPTGQFVDLPNNNIQKSLSEMRANSLSYLNEAINSCK